MATEVTIDEICCALTGYCQRVAPEIFEIQPDKPIVQVKHAHMRTSRASRRRTRRKRTARPGQSCSTGSHDPFGDTTGMANPRQVRKFFEFARAALGEDVELTAHFHNTRGQGLANVVAAIDAGVRSFESSVGEMGGCPVPAGATGNIATEDLVSMLEEMGMPTGVDLPALLDCSRHLQSLLGRPMTSHTIVAGPVAWGGGEAGAAPG